MDDNGLYDAIALGAYGLDVRGINSKSQSLRLTLRTARLLRGLTFSGLTF
ncbi:Hypothetical protein Y17_0484 [Pectobacterium wasabiae CFBP 3304]|nr:Hypothetical protein Y17_0484 [Pectobacterium wasabiae CFBP 3304]